MKLLNCILLLFYQLIGCAVGHRSVIALDTCQKDMMAKAMFTLIVLDIVLGAFFFEPQLIFKFLS